MSVKVKIEGLKEAQVALRKLPDATAKSVLRRIGKKRLKPVADKARDNVSEDEGHLKESITVSTRLTKSQRRQHRKINSNDVEVFAGAGSNPQAIWIEFGTGERRQKKTGKSVGKIDAHPFMRPAWDAAKRMILVGIRKDLWTEIRKAAARLARKALKGK